MKDKVFTKKVEGGLWEKYPHIMIGVVALIFGISMLTSFFLDLFNLFLFIVTFGSVALIVLVIRKISWDKASDFIGFIKRDNVLYAIRLYGDYSEAGTYIPNSPGNTASVLLSAPNNINYAKNSLELEEYINSLSDNEKTYISCLNELLQSLASNKNNLGKEDINYKLDMFFNKYGFKTYDYALDDGFFFGYIIMINPKIVKSNKKCFELSFIDENNKNKKMRFKNVYDGLLDELK